MDSLIKQNKMSQVPDNESFIKIMFDSAEFWDPENLKSLEVCWALHVESQRSIQKISIE